MARHQPRPRARYQLTDGTALGVELRDLDARDRLAGADLPRAAWIAAHPPPRRRAAGVDLELRPALGKVVAGPSSSASTSIASAGVTALWTDRVRPAASLGLGVRVRLGPRIRLDVGVHDDVYRQPRAGVDRGLAAGGPIGAGQTDTIHAVEARIGVTNPVATEAPRPRRRHGPPVPPQPARRSARNLEPRSTSPRSDIHPPAQRPPNHVRGDL